MPRLTNPLSGVIINVSDETAELLGSAWVPADATKAEEKPKRRNSSASS